jgi:hypothetical protein
MPAHDSTTYDPFGWRLAELADLRVHPVRRLELEDSLVVCEAEEIALGRRHLTVVHGDPHDVAQSRALDRLYDDVSAIAATAEWSRVRGGVDHVTVTVGGGAADSIVVHISAAAAKMNPGSWNVAESPYPSRR